MSELILPPSIQQIADRGRISQEDVQNLRRDKFADGKISRKEAEHLFALDNSASFKCHEWTEFFAEAIVNHVVYADNKQGHVSAGCAGWLQRCLSKNTVIETHDRMEILVKVLEVAKSAPEALQMFALEQVKSGILGKTDLLDRGRYVQNLEITRSDVDMIRRLMFAYAGDQAMAVTKAEAEFLFELNDLSDEQRNDPAWSDLFVKAIANHLLAPFTGFSNKRREILDKDSFLQGESITDYLVRSLTNVFNVMTSDNQRVQDRYGKLNDNMSPDDTISGIGNNLEGQWVIERIKSDGFVRESEKALLEFLKKEKPNLPRNFTDLLEQAS